MLTTDRNEPLLNETDSSGQNKAYLVLSEEERQKGFVRPVRNSYTHVGKSPKYPLRDLTEDEQKQYAQFGYVKYEEYPEELKPLSGRFWTRKDLNGRCGTTTTMGQALAETYARNPKFYGSTFCVHCGAHFSVDEFVWSGTDEPVGS